MVSKWFETIAPEVVDDLLEDMLAEASEEENMSILFNILQNFLRMAARGCEAGHGVMQTNGVVGAVAILCFLREHLRLDHTSPANGVLRRFYNAAHRKLLKAHRDEQVILFHELRASIAKLTRKPYSRMFLLNCMEETTMSKQELTRFILCDEVRNAIFRRDHSMRMFSGEGVKPQI